LLSVWARRHLSSSVHSGVIISLVVLLPLALVCLAMCLMAMSPQKDQALEVARRGLRAAAGPCVPQAAMTGLNAGAGSRSPTSDSTTPMKFTPSPSRMEPAASIELDSYLCPDLIVPASCECILRVPQQSPRQGAFSVTDMNGVEVLNVVLRPGVSGDAGGGQCIALTTGEGHTLAQCVRVQARSTGGPEFHLLRSTGEDYGQLVRSSGRDDVMYTVRLRSSVEIYFWGSFEQHTINITDNLGRLLAMSEALEDSESLPRPLGSPRAKCYKLRVAPLMDVSIVLCGLMCIDHLV